MLGNDINNHWDGCETNWNGLCTCEYCADEFARDMEKFVDMYEAALAKKQTTTMKESI